MQFPSHPIYIRSKDKKTELSEIDPQISVNRLVLKINKETSLDIELPMNLKDEATHAKFTKKTGEILSFKQLQFILIYRLFTINDKNSKA